MKDMEEIKINNLYGSFIEIRFESKAHLDTFLASFFSFLDTTHEI
jgi:hypothetical protein